jgi:hypothetical protein
MITQDTVLVQLIRLVDRIPTPPAPSRRPRGRPVFYSERPFLKALVIMIVKRLHKVGELLAVLEEDTPRVRDVRRSLCEGGRFLSKRTFQRLPERSVAWDATWWRCPTPGRVREERWPSTGPFCRQKVR